MILQYLKIGLIFGFPEYATTKIRNPNAHLYKGDLFAKIIIKVERSTDTSAAVAVGESTENLEGEN